MRIAICNTFGRFLGGIESYLSHLIPALADKGDQVAAVFEEDSPSDHARLPVPEHTWWASESALSRVLDELREWRPEIVYVNGIHNWRLEQGLLELAPAVLFAHDYSATCISGQKAFGFPVTKPCSRRFGAQCLLNYFPRHCGGFSPVTMLRQYHSRAARLTVMRRYRFVLVAAEAMRREYSRHGFMPGQVEVVQYPIELATLHSGSGEVVPESTCADQVRSGIGSEPVRLLFAGRMVPLKGGEVLLQALPYISRTLHRPVKLIMVGDGPAKLRWEAQSRKIYAQHPSITVEFTGWQQRAALQRLTEACDLLMVPSLWPEPFGMIGPEAGYAQLPAVAFAVGGIPEWLHDGVNGILAPADPPSAAGLASAVTKCLASPSFHAQLRQGAKREAMKFSLERHVNKLLAIFAQSVNDGSRV